MSSCLVCLQTKSQEELELQRRSRKIDKDVNKIREVLPDFKGNWRDVEDVKKFLLYYFITAKRNPTKSLYNHFTVAVDTNNIRIVFKDVKDTILKKNLDALLLQ